MKYSTAVKQWNDKKQKSKGRYCHPKKGSQGYAEVKKIQLGSDYVHKYKTRSKTTKKK